MNGHVLYRFEEYRVDPARRELWRHEEQVAVQPKAFDCLSYLIEHRNRVVGSDELIAAVWGRTDLSDNVVMHSIARARQALGDSGDQQRAIRTVTRVGYAWNLPVEVVSLDGVAHGQTNGHASANGTANGHVNDSDLADSVSASHDTLKNVGAVNGEIEPAVMPSGSSPAVETGHATRKDRSGKRAATRRRYWFACAAGCVTLIAVAAIGLLSAERPSPQPVVGETAIVLPVTVAGGADSHSAWIRLGIMDLIAERLRELGQMVVPSDNTVALARAYLKSEEDGAYRVEDVEALADTVSAGLVLGAEAEAVGNGHWRVSLRTVYGRDPVVVAQGDATDLLAASRAAADRMAVMLGFDLAPQQAEVPEAEDQIDYVLRRVRAALLSDHFDQVRAILAGLDETQRRDPRVRFEMAALDAQRGQDDTALATLRSLLADLPENDHALLRAKTLHRLGVIHARQNDYPEALALDRQALAVLRGRQSYEERLSAGRILMSMAGLLALQEQLDESEATYAKARIALELSGDQFALAKLDVGLSTLYSRMGRSEAIAYAKRGAERLGQFGDAQNEVRARVHLVIAYFNEQDIAAAAEEVRYFDALLARIDNPLLSTQVRIYELAVLVESGQLAAAARLLEQIQEGQVDEAAAMLINYYAAGHAFASQAFEAAVSLAKTAVEAKWEPGRYGDKAHAWLLLHRAQVELGQIESAAGTLQRAIEWSVVAGDRKDVQLPLTLMKAEYAVVTGDDAAASSHFERALVMANQWGQPDALVRAVKPYVEWLIDEGDLDRAGVLAGRVSNWADRSYDAAWVQLRLYHALGEPSGWRLALRRARALAGERTIEPELLIPPELRIATAI